MKEFAKGDSMSIRVKLGNAMGGLANHCKYIREDLISIAQGFLTMDNSIENAAGRLEEVLVRLDKTNTQYQQEFKEILKSVSDQLKDDRSSLPEQLEMEWVK